jgi:hypothetical protein
MVHCKNKWLGIAQKKETCYKSLNNYNQNQSDNIRYEKFACYKEYHNREQSFKKENDVTDYTHDLNFLKRYNLIRKPAPRLNIF